MVEVDPVLWAIVIAILGLIMWAVTNIRLTRTGKAIKADIDEKRATTEEFVEKQLLDLRTGLQEELGKEFNGQALEARVEAKMDTFKSFLSEEMEGLESRLATVQIDARPIMEQVEATLIPAVVERVENVKSSLLGHLGFAKKSVKALAEGAVEIVGERAVTEAGFEHEWEVKLAQLGMDDPWLKEHKTVALGLEFIKEAMRGGRKVEFGEIVGGVPSGAKSIGPPKGFR